DPVAGGVGAGGGERDLVRGGGQRPLLGGVAGLALQAQAGGGHAADRAAVLVQQRSVAAEHGAGVGDLVQVAYLLQGLLRQHGRGLLGVGLLGVDPGDGGEPVGGPHHLGAERLLQGAAEDQGPGDEHDAEGDGQGGGGEAGLVQAQAGQGGAEHGFSGLQGEQAVGDGLGGGGVQLVGEAPVAQEHHPVGVGGGDRVVGDHDDGLAQFAGGFAEEGQDLGAGAGVEVAGGLVGVDHLGRAQQGPGHRHPLLLAAGELGGQVVQARTQPGDLDEAGEPLPVDGALGDLGGQQDVLL